MMYGIAFLVENRSREYAGLNSEQLSVWLLSERREVTMVQRSTSRIHTTNPRLSDGEGRGIQGKDMISPTSKSPLDGVVLFGTFICFNACHFLLSLRRSLGLVAFHRISLRYTHCTYPTLTWFLSDGYPEEFLTILPTQQSCG